MNFWKSTCKPAVTMASKGNFSETLVFSGCFSCLLFAWVVFEQAS